MSGTSDFSARVAFSPAFSPLAATSPTTGIKPTAKAAELIAVPNTSPFL